MALFLGCGPAVDVAGSTSDATQTDSGLSAEAGSESSDGSTTAAGSDGGGSESGAGPSGCSRDSAVHHRSVWIEHGGQCLTRVDTQSMSIAGRFATTGVAGARIAASVSLAGDVLVVNDNAAPGEPWLVKITGDPSRCVDADGAKREVSSATRRELSARFFQTLLRRRTPR